MYQSVSNLLYKMEIIGRIMEDFEFHKILICRYKISKWLINKEERKPLISSLRAASGTRTHDLFVTNEMLYQLSYCG